MSSSFFFRELVFEFGFYVNFQAAEHGRIYGRNGKSSVSNNYLENLL